jgi:hypothetical protein
MWKPAEKLSMTEEQRTTLNAWVGAKTSPQRTVLRARICLLAADGLLNRIIETFEFPLKRGKSSYRRKPVSSLFNIFWTPAFAGVTTYGRNSKLSF